jgi:hypothetical protein
MNFEHWYADNSPCLAKKFAGEVRLRDILGFQDEETERTQRKVISDAEKLASATEHLDKEYDSVRNELEVMTKSRNAESSLIAARPSLVDGRNATPEAIFASRKLLGFDWTNCVARELNGVSDISTYWISTGRWKDTWMDLNVWKRYKVV